MRALIVSIVLASGYAGSVADPSLIPAGRIQLVGADGGLAQVIAHQVGIDGGTPSFVMLGAGGQELKATDDPTNPGLFVRWDEQTLQELDVRLAQLAKGITDSCATGLRISGSSVTDQAIDTTARNVPIRSDGGLAYDDLYLVQIDVQNVTVAPAKSLRCAYTSSGADAGPASCTRGTRIDQGFMASFTARYPDYLSCICCQATTPTAGCSAASAIQRCVQP